MSAAPVLAAASAAVCVLGIRRLVAAPLSPAWRRGPVAPGLLARTGPGRRLGARLVRGGIPLGPDAFAAVTAAGALACGVLAFIALRTPVAPPMAAATAVAVAVGVVRSADRRYLGRVEAQLPGVAQQLAAALGAGLSLRQSLARAARDAPDPVRAELTRTTAELEMGSRLESALEGLAERVPAHDLRIMVTAILVQRRTGGNLARALGALSERLEERAQLARELKGATAQARMTAWMVAALPVGGGVMTEVAAPGTLARTLGQGPGPVLLLASGALYGAGVIAIRRIGRVEP